MERRWSKDDFDKGDEVSGLRIGGGRVRPTLDDSMAVSPRVRDWRGSAAKPRQMLNGREYQKEQPRETADVNQKFDRSRATAALAGAAGNAEGLKGRTKDKSYEARIASAKRTFEGMADKSRKHTKHVDYGKR